MAENSKIEWTDDTWNPIIGCSIVSPGCTLCYAMRDAYRKGFNPKVPQYHGLAKLVNGNPVWTGKIHMNSERAIRFPLDHKKPRMMFVNSMGDLFHEDIPDAWIDRVFAIMAMAPQHTYQVLTKRARRMRQYMSTVTLDRIAAAATDGTWPLLPPAWPLPHVWLGVSTERQQEADERIPELLATPDAVRFISAEPLIGPITLKPYLVGEPRLDWVIVGGESGPEEKLRPMDEAWARSIRDECVAAGVPFFMKQMTRKKPIPDDLLVRQWPTDSDTCSTRSAKAA
jgi:protein gp37